MAGSFCKQAHRRIPSHKGRKHSCAGLGVRHLGTVRAVARRSKGMALYNSRSQSLINHAVVDSAGCTHT